MSGQARFTVVVADDQPLYRQGMALAIAAREELNLVGEAADGPGAVSLCLALQPNLALVDLDMPGLDGVAVCEQLAVQPESRATRVVLISDSDTWPAPASQAPIKAHAYVSKAATAQEICDTLVTVAGK